MIAKIDNFLLGVAKKIVLFFGFFGISAKTLTYSYLLITSVLAFQYTIQDTLGCAVFNAVVGFIFVGVMHLPFVIEGFRYEDRFPNIIAYNNPVYRVFFIIFFFIVVSLGTLLFFFYRSSIPQLILLVSKILVPHCYVYFVLNKNTKNKVTLCGLLKKASEKIKKALSPKPQTEPVPAPSLG